MTCHDRSHSEIAPPSRPAATDPLVRQCQDARTRQGFLQGTPETPLVVVVAVSGGADSVALLHLLHHLSAAWSLILHVAHIDHNLRPDSSADAHVVAQLATAWGLPFHHHRLPANALVDRPEGVEAAGRRARYQFLTQVAVAVTPPAQTPGIALAHHVDDQAETLLLHLVRGSGLRGLGGMQWVSSRLVGDLWPDAPLDQQSQSLQLIRPLLGVQRADLLRYLRTQGLTWREDSSNADQGFIRNRLRHTVLPALAIINPNIGATLARTAHILQAEADRVTALDQAALATLLVEPAWSFTELQAWQQQTVAAKTATAPARVVLNGTDLLALPLAAQRGVLREAVGLLAQVDTPLDFAHSEAILAGLQPPVATSGPHPLVAQVAWSIASATANTPVRLSLHQMRALPFAPTHPFLDAQWRENVGSLLLPETGTLTVTDGWSLTINRTLTTALPTDWRSGGQRWRAYLDADQVGTPVLTTPRRGQTFAPLGMAGRHKMVGDFFTDRKIPVALRSGWPLIVDQVSGEILWVCGYQPSHHARITAETQQVLWLGWQRDGG